MTILRTLLASAAIAACPLAVSAQIVLDREAVLLNPTKSGERVAELVVRNAGVVDVDASVRLEDWDLDAGGASHWQTSGKVMGSCGDRVSASPSSLRLAPGEQRTVRIAIKANARFEAECWSAAVVQPAARSASDDSSQTALSLRATVPLYVTPSGLSVDGEVRDMYVKGDSLEVLFANTGKMRTDIVGQVEVRAENDSVVATIPLDAATVLAGGTRKLRIAMPKLSKGKYVLLAVVDFGGKELTAAQAALEIQ